jgi:galactonate dehydratase
MESDVPHRRQVTNESVALLRDGSMPIGTAPGLGIDIDLEAIAAHPYQPRDLRHYNGGLTDIRPPEASRYFGRDGAGAHVSAHAPGAGPEPTFTDR